MNVLQLNADQYKVMQADKVVQSVSTDTRVVHQQVSSPSSAPTATAASSPPATAAAAAAPQATTSGSAASPATTSPTTAATPAATAITSSTAAAAAPAAADTSSTMPSAGTVANSSTTANAEGEAAGGTVTRVSTLQVQMKAPYDLDIIDQADLPLDGKYEYTNDGTGVNVYVFDTVSAQASCEAACKCARCKSYTQKCSDIASCSACCLHQAMYPPLL